MIDLKPPGELQKPNQIKQIPVVHNSATNSGPASSAEDIGTSPPAHSFIETQPFDKLLVVQSLTL